jgi:transcriptional regulator with GAF, ATPase, and Fis domain
MPSLDDTGFEEVISDSPALPASPARVHEVAPSDATIALESETRTSGLPFVPVNCAALAPTLVESELLGSP